MLGQLVMNGKGSPGRPRLAPEEKLDQKMVTKVTRSMLAAAEDTAAREERSVSDWLRTLIRKGIAQYEGYPPYKKPTVVVGPGAIGSSKAKPRSPAEEARKRAIWDEVI